MFAGIINILNKWNYPKLKRKMFLKVQKRVFYKGK